MERHADRTGGTPGDPRLGPSPSDDEVAREMIARIARQVDLEVGRRPVDPEPEPEVEHEPVEEEAVAEEAVGQVAAPRAEASEEPRERSEEDVSRALVERIAREVDEERGG